MQAVIYAGLRNPGRDQLIFNALIRNTVSEVAEKFSCAPSTIRAAVRRIADLNVYELRLTGGVKTSRLDRLPPSHSGALRWAPIATSAGRSGILSYRPGPSPMAPTPFPFRTCATSTAAAPR